MTERESGGSDAPSVAIAEGARLSPREADALRRTALHEASHAVVGVRRGWKLLRASIRAGEGYSGLCGWKAKLAGIDGAAIALAGPSAGDRVGDDRDPWDLAQESFRDTVIAVNLTRELADGDDAANALYRATEQSVLDLLSSPGGRRDVALIAEALLRLEELSGEEIELLLGAS